jgi:hypothetical protein
MARRNSTKKCLIIERHEWETGGHEQQLQIPLEVASSFFGPADRAHSITVRLLLPPSAASPAFEKTVRISKEYRNGTRRINGFTEIGYLGSCFMFFEETSSSDVYNVWWEQDKAIVAARFHGWQQASGSQYGRGRLAIIVPAPVPRQIDRI